MNDVRINRLPALHIRTSRLSNLCAYEKIESEWNNEIWKKIQCTRPEWWWPHIIKMWQESTMGNKNPFATVKNSQHVIRLLALNEEWRSFWIVVIKESLSVLRFSLSSLCIADRVHFVLHHIKIKNVRQWIPHNCMHRLRYWEILRDCA